ncbi:MAG TPA: arabinan endo-1,5-alpha-L-arabinosidase [Pirellulales bacterium]|nr:arabinan endo-1,5-alpha-L-arabinosidase [Pirellulales bacterium]
MKFRWQLFAVGAVGFMTAYAAVVMFAQNPSDSNPSASKPAVSNPAAPSTDEQQEMLRRDGNRGIRVHDPSTIVKCKDEFWVFATGTNTPSFHSKDLEHWIRGPRANANPPAWVKQAIPRNRGNDFWAPDIIHVGDKYLLFFAASSFGKNTSAIGVATNPTLDPSDPAYHWTDGGIVVQSKETDDFNALDPAAFLDQDGKLWLSFGSFWSGIKLIELDPATGLRISPDSPMVSLAHWDSIEAPYIYFHDGRYYLFVNQGLCCRGVNSTYRICIGRADKVTGPYLDKDGKDMLLTGGTILLDRDGPFIGPGHAGIIEDQGKYWFSCHFYDGTDRGVSKLSVRPLTWGADGWPVVGKLDEAQ